MSIDISALATSPRLLFAIPLRPIQGQRFQPTGFPSLGAATFRSSAGDCLLVESAQSMANRLESTVWDEASQDLVEVVRGISHVRVTRADGSFLTDSVLEAHRLNSPYLLEGSNKQFMELLKAELGGLGGAAVSRQKLATVLLKLDSGCLLHGVFLAKKELAGGRLRLARALSAFIEAEQVRVAASGGVKNDRVNPSGEAKEGFGNVPFARDEFTAERITLYVNLDLAQIRGYGLGEPATRMLILMALYKLRRLVDGSLRLRTACELALTCKTVEATVPAGFELPAQAPLADALRVAISACAASMTVTTAVFSDPITSKKQPPAKAGGEEEEPAES